MSLKPTRQCKRCFRTRHRDGLQVQVHPETGVAHRVHPTWATERGWGFRSLCGVPVIFWKPTGLGWDQ